MVLPWPSSLLCPSFSLSLSSLLDSFTAVAAAADAHTCTVGETAEPMATTSGAVAAAAAAAANGSQEHSLSPLPVILPPPPLPSLARSVSHV